MRGTTPGLHRGLLAALLLPSCSAAPGAERTDSGSVSLTVNVSADTGGASGETGSDSQSADSQSSQDEGSSAGAGDEAPKFDIGDGAFCEQRPAGLFCDGKTSVQCDGDGNVVDSNDCTPDLCVEGTGCVTCTAGQWTCKGPRVMTCNDQGVPFWEETQVCNPAANEYCDISVMGCTTLADIGGIEPTGEYYLYSTYSPEGFNTISDVDSFDNRVYFTGYQGAQLIVGAYDVAIMDSDGDGELEPHQHPDSQDDPGPIEERVFTFVQAIPISNGGAVPHQMEIYATGTTLYWAGPQQITAYDLATGTTSVEAPKSAWIGSLTYGYLAFLGYDDINGVWYSGNESARRVFQYDDETMQWGYAFQFPVLAGDHMDGMDVVTDTSSGIPYIYVSDMTSNFIGQYRHDPVMGWVQENLFSYAENTGVPVEGFGFGALSHFWVGGWNQNSFYEIGGGDLTEFLDPAG